MNDYLNIGRLGYLGRRHLIFNWRSMAIAGGAVAGVTFVMVFVQALFTRQVDMDYSSMVIGTMAIWGTISASMAFSDLHNKERNDSYLLLPASSVEKVLIQLLFSSIVLPLAIILLVTLTSIVSEGVAGLLFGTGFQPLNPFLGIHFKVWGYVVIGQSVFFLGSAWFRKAHFIKTVLTLTVGGIALGILSGVFFRIIFASYFDGFWNMVPVNVDFEDVMSNAYPRLSVFLFNAARVVFYAVLAPFCWFTAWLRVKETQTSDGV